MHRLDELLPVYIILKTPILEASILKSYLARLVITVEALAFSTIPPPDGELQLGPKKESIHSSTLKDTDKPLILRHGDGDDAHVYVIWKVEAFISRPNGRFHKPAIYFQPTSTFKPASIPKKAAPEDEYLPSRVPAPLNLLQAFDNDPDLEGVHPRLSAMRINKITPRAPVFKEIVQPMRTGQRPVFRVLPVMNWRLRYARVHTSLNDLSLLASLDLEFASFATYDVKINNVNLTLQGGAVHPFPHPQNSETSYKPGDQLTYLYKLTPSLSTNGTPALGPKGHVLSIHIKAQVLLSPTCHPTIAIDSKTPVDFTSASEQSPSMLKAAHRVSNPSTQPVNPDALPAHDTGTDDNAAKNAINITLTISGPPKVTVGSPFEWNVFIVNRSDNIRKLAVVVIPKRKPTALHTSHTSSSSAAGLKNAAAPKELLAPAVVDENIVYARQKSARPENADLICLTTDIRLGQLGPGSCYTADLKFMPLVAGVLGVESVRVIDLATNESVDVRELPGVVAVEGEEESEEEREQ